LRLSEREGVASSLDRAGGTSRPGWRALGRRTSEGCRPNEACGSRRL